MTPSDIYAMPYYKLGNLADMLNYKDWDGFPENILPYQAPNIDGLEVRTHAYHHLDERRFYSVFSVWFFGNPVAFGRMAGREGDDSYARYITDSQGFEQLTRAVWAATLRPESKVKQVGLDDDIGNFMSWYGETLKPGERTRGFGW